MLWLDFENERLKSLQEGNALQVGDRLKLHGVDETSHTCEELDAQRSTSFAVSAAAPMPGATA